MARLALKLSHPEIEMQKVKSYNVEDRKALAFYAEVKGHAHDAAEDGIKFDSAAASVQGALSKLAKEGTSCDVPASVGAMFDSYDEKARQRVLTALLDGADQYRRAHGVEPPPDLLRTALHAGMSVMDASLSVVGVKAAPPMFDDTIASASTVHSDPRAHQPNRTVLAIVATMAEACPFALYLPADINSGEARMSVLTHIAGGSFGAYDDGSSLDGENGGQPFMDSTRRHSCTVTDLGSTSSIAGYLTRDYSAVDTCDQTLVSGADGGMKWIRGRGRLYINGQVVAVEAASPFTSTGTNSVSGTFSIGATSYVISGTFNPDTGQVSLVSTPDLPANTVAIFESFIDWERDGDNIPLFKAAANTYNLFAHPWRGYTTVSIDSRNQMSRELGVDPYQEAMTMINVQLMQERHYHALRLSRLLAVGKGLTSAFDFAYAAMGVYKTSPEIWLELQRVLGELSQRMAAATFSHGISHLYVGKYVAHMLMACPGEIFQPSGVQVRPGIYRVGRLFGQYEVYYSPRHITEDTSGDTAEILCIGRGPDVVRTPIVFGECVAPTMIPLATNRDMNTAQAMYAKNLTEVNPWNPAASGAALITVTNLFTAPA